MKDRKHPETTGKLRIGDDWNAITIIASSQSNPLKAVAEFVENSIDARARQVTIVRGKEKGEHYLRIKDDGQGIPRNVEGLPDFHYVATHICDSIKRRLKAQGAQGLQGEYGIGLLSFWILGEELTMASAGQDGRTYQMHMHRGNPDYWITQKHTLLPEPGAELVIRRILPGIKQFSGDKIQWYLASELRDRIRSSGVEIRVVDRTARAEYRVEPRQFEGRLLHDLPRARLPESELYVELYLNEPAPVNHVSLYRSGTRVLDSLAELEPLNKPPWTSGYCQGVIDAPYLHLTPGTRLGVIHDEALNRFLQELAPLEAELRQVIEAQQRAAEEQTSRAVLRSIQNALKEALLTLPAEEYDWFNVRAGEGKARGKEPVCQPASAQAMELHEEGGTQATPQPEDAAAPAQMQFFEHAGPLFGVKISPGSSVLGVNQARSFRAIARDRTRRLVEDNLSFRWEIAEAQGQLDRADGEMATLVAPSEPGLLRLQLTVTQGDIVCQAEALITVTDTLLPADATRGALSQGIPGYTLQKAPGQLWRSRFDTEQNVIVINNGHRDFVYAARHRTLKLRYLCRLFVKELVLKNFLGLPADQLLERLIELTLYTEEHLK